MGEIKKQSDQLYMEVWKLAEKLGVQKNEDNIAKFGFLMDGISGTGWASGLGTNFFDSKNIELSSTATREQINLIERLCATPSQEIVLAYLLKASFNLADFRLLTSDFFDVLANSYRIIGQLERDAWIKGGSETILDSIRIKISEINSKNGKAGSIPRHENREKLKMRAQEMYASGNWKSRRNCATQIAPLLLKEASGMFPCPLRSPDRAPNTVYGWLLEKPEKA